MLSFVLNKNFTVRNDNLKLSVEHYIRVIKPIFWAVSSALQSLHDSRRHAKNLKLYIDSNYRSTFSQQSYTFSFLRRSPCKCYKEHTFITRVMYFAGRRLSAAYIMDGFTTLFICVLSLKYYF